MTNNKTTLSQLLSQDEFPDDAFYIHKMFKNRKIIVYGAGESFHYLKEIVIRQYGYIPSVVLDRKFCTNDTFEGIPAFSPLKYRPSAEEQKTGLVVVCLGNQNYREEVVLTLQLMGFQHIISLMDIYEIHNPFCQPQELEDSGFKYFLKQRELIESCLDILEDDDSREIYTRCLQTHLQRKPILIPMCNRNEQYTPKGIRLSQGYSRFIYCGVSVDEMARVFDDVGMVNELVCFEPDPNQFRLVSEYLSTHQGGLARRITAFPCAVYSHEAIKTFTYSDTSFGSRILPSGTDRIQTISIDHALPGFQPTFINMDIEGAELEALKGATKTIRASRPDLAICVYHCPNHIWEIPHYLNEMELGYKFYLRNYTSLISETVLYATT